VKDAAAEGVVLKNEALWWRKGRGIRNAARRQCPERQQHQRDAGLRRSSATSGAPMLPRSTP
jgi:hypothetical protein